MKITIKHKIFSNGEKSLDFLINHIIEEFIYYNSCSTPCKIKLLNIDSNKIINKCRSVGARDDIRPLLRPFLKSKYLDWCGYFPLGEITAI